MVWNLPAGALEALTRLNRRRFQAFVVGGCVRDMLRNQTPQDWDICTSARPEQILDLFAGCRTVETGRAHGTIAVWLEGNPYEITTFRVDGSYTDHRRPDRVEFVPRLEADLARRDFTVNAMAYHPGTGLVDPFGGRMDLQRGVIRAVGDPDRRLREDSLRILRALRFSSVLGFCIEEGTAASIRSGCGLLRLVAMERVRDELCKLLLGSGAAGVLVEYADVFAMLLPECFSGPGAREAWGRGARAAASAPRELPVRLALLLWGSGETGRRAGEAARPLLERLRLDRETRRYIAVLLAERETVIIPEERAVRRVLSRLGAQPVRDLLQLQRAAAGEGLSDAESVERLQHAQRLLDRILGEKQCYRLRDLAVNGGDLLALGLAPGPEVGRLLQQLLDRVLDGELKNRRADLLAFAGRRLAEQNKGTPRVI